MFFYHLPDSVTSAFEQRGVPADSILYTAKADVSRENQYEEIYLALTRDELCILYGHERYLGKKHHETRILYDVSDYRSIPLASIKEVVIDRLYTVSSFILKTDEEEFTVCRLSLSSVGLFEKFRSRILALRDNTPIDDSGLKDEHRVCPKCKRPYPNQERTICPNCLSNTVSFKRLLKEYLSHKKEAVLIFALILVSSVLTLIVPLFSSQMFYDQVLTKPSVINGTVYGKYYGKLAMVVLMIFGIKLIASFFSSLYGIIVSKISCEVLNNLRVKIFSSMQRLSMNFFVSKATGTLMTRIDDDADWLYFFFVDLIPYYIVSVLTVIGLVVVMCTISPLLTILIFASILLIGFAIRHFRRYMKRLNRRQHRAIRSMKSVITDSLGGQKVVKSFAREEQEVDRFDSRNGNYFNTRMVSSYYGASRFPLLIWR